MFAALVEMRVLNRVKETHLLAGKWKKKQQLSRLEMVNRSRMGASTLA